MEYDPFGKTDFRGVYGVWNGLANKYLVTYRVEDI